MTPSAPASLGADSSSLLIVSVEKSREPKFWMDFGQAGVESSLDAISATGKEEGG